MLPAKGSQMVLMQQRLNMVTFLEGNEKNALEGIKKDFTIDDQEWSKIMNTIHKEVTFNQQAMRKKYSYIPSTHDASLPEAWVNALNRECARHGILPENLNFGTTANPNTFANAQTNRPRLSSDGSVPITYFIAAVRLNLESAVQETPQYLNNTAGHELVHIIKNHGLRCCVIIDEIYTPKGLEHTDSHAYKNLCAAQEKTADTLVACADAEYAHNYAHLVNKDFLEGIYPDNHNDVETLHANWQLSEILTNSQQLKSLITQKLNAFPTIFAQQTRA